MINKKLKLIEFVSIIIISVFLRTQILAFHLHSEPDIYAHFDTPDTHKIPKPSEIFPDISAIELQRKMLINFNSQLGTLSDIKKISEITAKTTEVKLPVKLETPTACPGGECPKEAIGDYTWDSFLERSNSFYQKIKIEPTQNNRIKNIINEKLIKGTSEEKKNNIVKFVNNTYPIAHPRTIKLAEDFLNYKIEHGTKIEKELYNGMSVNQFITRLLSNRPLAFFGQSDSYVLRDGVTNGFDYPGKLFYNNGTELQKAPIELKNYISYDEMGISALLGVSVPTYFINDGDRKNMGKMGKDGSFEQVGVITGLVGARFERLGKMEWRHVLITKEQNTPKNGYGIGTDVNKEEALKLAHWANFYGIDHFPSYEEAAADKSGKYTSIPGNQYFNNNVYKHRIQAVIEPFLIDANIRAKQEGKKAYVYVVGLGLGVWRVSGAPQTNLMVDAYAQVIKNTSLSYISDIEFGYFNSNTTIDGVGNGGIIKEHSGNPIMIHIPKFISKEEQNLGVSPRNPADKLGSQDENKLLIVQYAWDSNSFPGNEYWAGQLDASGDPAAACFSLIPELQNPLINTNNVSGEKLKTLGNINF